MVKKTLAELQVDIETLAAKCFDYATPYSDREREKYAKKLRKAWVEYEAVRQENELKRGK